MAISCAVKGCHSFIFNRPNLSFHSFSKDNNYRANKWLGYTRCNKNCPKDKNFFLCWLHFKLKDFPRDLTSS